MYFSDDSNVELMDDGVPEDEEQRRGHEDCATQRNHIHIFSDSYVEPEIPDTQNKTDQRNVMFSDSYEEPYILEE